MLEQSRHEVVDAVPFQRTVRDERLEVREAADIDADLDPRIEGRQPPRHGAAHRQPERADARGIDVRAALQIIERAQAVEDHHSPHDLTRPEHLAKDFSLAAASALAESPGVDAERGVAQLGQRVSVGWSLQHLPPSQQLVFPQDVVAAVRVVVEDDRQGPLPILRSHEIRRDWLDAVEVQHQRLQDVLLALFFRPICCTSSGRDRGGRSPRRS